MRKHRLDRDVQPILTDRLDSSTTEVREQTRHLPRRVVRLLIRHAVNGHYRDTRHRAPLSIVGIPQL